MRSNQLNDAHEIDPFDCGVDDLNRWLHESARDAQRAGTANTFVWTRDGTVVAYYSLSAHVIMRELLPAKDLRGAPEVIPAYIVGKLALDRSLQGQGMGGVLLWDAFERGVRGARSGAAAKVIVVDAKNEAAKKLYGEHAKNVTNDPSRFYIKISTAERALAPS